MFITNNVTSSFDLRKPPDVDGNGVVQHDRPEWADVYWIIPTKKRHWDLIICVGMLNIVNLEYAFEVW